MASIFVSYNRRSEGIAKTLADDIEALGHTVWFDHELSGGQVWWDQILARVRSCDVFVFVLNRESLDSTACKREYDYAADLGKPILPVLVSDEVSINLLPPALTEIQFVDYIKQDREAAFRLARALITVPPARPLPDPLPVPPKVPLSYLGGLAEQIERASTLSYQDQSALLVDLKRGLRDPETARDAENLLARLRKRHDLLAAIADEIDDLRPPRRKATPDVPPTSETESTRQRNQQGTEETTPRLAAASSTDDQKARSQKPVVVTPSVDHKSTRRERIKGVLYLALTGVVVGLLCLAVFSRKISPYEFGYRNLVQDYPWFFAIGGVVSGAIAGMNRRGRVAAGVVMFAVAALVLAVEPFPPYSSLFHFSALLAPPLGALIGRYIPKRTMQA